MSIATGRTARGRIFLFSTASRPALGHTQPPMQWVSREISPGVKQPGREDDHSHPSSAEVKNCEAIPPLPPHVFMAECLINQAQEQLYLSTYWYMENCRRRSTLLFYSDCTTAEQWRAKPRPGHKQNCTFYKANLYIQIWNNEQKAKISAVN
jgi:hypothetical protein